MPGEPRVISQDLGGGSLARAARDLTGTRWHVPRPGTPDGWRARASAVAEGAPAGWLDGLRAAFGDTAVHLDAVAGGRGVVVTTGQQPGLFGGPLYGLHKALSALELARSIEASTGVPARAVFWAATDDADFVEARATWIRVPGGSMQLRLARDPTEGIPMAEVPLGDVTGELRALAGSARSAPHRRPLELVHAAYGGAATVGGAYLALLRGLLEPLGMAVIDASHPALLEAGGAVLRAALVRGAEVDEALRARDTDLRGAGHAPQVALVDGLSLVFARTAGGRKVRVPLSEARGVAARAADGGLSPNVLLRPVLERSVLPSVAYVAGPGELAYFAQVAAVAEALDVASPLGVPRWSATIVEPDVARIIERLGIEWTALADPHAVEGAVARRRVPPSVLEATAEWRAQVDAAGARAGEALGAAGLGMDPRVVDGTRRALAHRLDRLERRVVAAAKRREHAVMDDIGSARGALFPGGLRQERALNIVPLLAGHGEGLVEAMRAAARRHADALIHGEPVPADP